MAFVWYFAEITPTATSWISIPINTMGYFSVPSRKEIKWGKATTAKKKSIMMSQACECARSPVLTMYNQNRANGVQLLIVCYIPRPWKSLKQKKNINHLNNIVVCKFTNGLSDCLWSLWSFVNVSLCNKR